MKEFSKFPIPVVALGAGSQPEDEEVNFLPMPSSMDTFSMPTLHHEADTKTLAATCTLLEELYELMIKSSPDGKDSVQMNLNNVKPQVLALINQSLGHGEVSIIIQGETVIRIQEAIFAGIWRMQVLSLDNVLQHDILCAGAIPHVVQESALKAASHKVAELPLKDGMMNAPAVLNELLDKSKKHQLGRRAHVVNLSLLPMSAEDIDYLTESLGVGTVTILSRGYGNCRISSTKLAHVWWVQYFNSTDQIILNTIEVVDVPEVAQAAPEDYVDSIERLEEWLSVMKEDIV